MPRRHDCPSLRAAYAELLDLKKRCKLALEEAKRTGDLGPARKLISLYRQKAKELGQQVSPIWEKVDVTYVMPSYEELKRRFPGGVEVFFNGRYRFELTKECKHISRNPRKIKFVYIQMDAKSTKGLSARMEKQGLRPAILEELICFAKRYPDESLHKKIIADGSFLWLKAPHDPDDEETYSPMLWHDDDHQTLTLNPDYTGWHEGNFFLVVKEDDVAVS